MSCMKKVQSKKLKIHFSPPQRKKKFKSENIFSKHYFSAKSNCAHEKTFLLFLPFFKMIL